MSHLATADSEVEFANLQLERFRAAADAFPGLETHIANSAAALRYPQSRFAAAARCGVALYGLSPFQELPSSDGLEPVLSWRSSLAQVKRLDAGESTGYGRRFVAERPTWIGLVPVGYADGFSRDLTGTQVLVAGERRTVVGTVSMDSFAVELPEELPARHPRHARRRRAARREPRGASRDDQLRDHDRHPVLPRADQARVRRWLTSPTGCARRSRAGRAGSSAAPCATSCSAARSSTSTSPAASPRPPRGRSRARAAARRFLSPSATGPGGSRSRTARTVDFTPLAGGIEDDLATRDFTLNAMARPVGGGELVDPFGGQADIAGRTIRAVTRRRLRGRSPAPAAGGPARGRARLPLRRRDGGARPPARVSRGPPGR